MNREGEQDGRVVAEPYLDRYLAYFASAPVAAMVVDASGRYLEVNPAACQLTGFEEAELLGMSLAELLAEESSEAGLQHFAQVKATGHASGELALIRKDGSKRWVDCNAVRLSDDRFIAFKLDTTERIGIEERALALRLLALHEPDHIIRACLDAAVALSGLESGGVYLADPASGRLQLLHHVGLSPEFAESVTSHDPGSVQERVLRDGRPVVFTRNELEQLGMLTALCEGLSVVVAVPVQIEGTVVACLNLSSRTTVSISTDVVLGLKSVAAQMGEAITRARAEESLRQSEARYRTLFMSMTQGAFCQQADGRIVDVNPAALRMFGLTRDELLSRTSRDSAWDVVYEDGTALPVSQHPSMVAMRTGKPVRNFVAGIHNPRTQDRVWLEVNATPEFRSGEREPYQVLVTLHDITERRRTEQQKLEMERRLLHSQKLESLGILAGGIAHDFNNILAGIAGYADLLGLRLPPSEPAREDVEVIKKAVQRAADLTKQMLEYSGMGKFVVKAVDLSQIVADTRKMLEVSVSKKAILTYDLAADLPPIEADPAQVNQVVLNLVINASEALGDDNGVIGIRTRTVQLSETGWAAVRTGDDARSPQYACLEVSDTGCGMDRETLAKIFDPFFSTKFAGRGLGLASLHGIVRGHKGGLRVTSEPGKGTTFQVFFPVATLAAFATPAEADRTPWRGSGTILIADDEELVRNAAKGMIEYAGFSVLTVNDGEEAVRTYRHHCSDVACVILDLTMPRLNGEETLRELRKINSSVRVVLSSGFSEDSTTERFSSLGLAGFIQKPYQFDTLLDMLRRVLA